MQLFKLRNTWNQYIPNKVLYDLDVRITRTDPNWPVSLPVSSGTSTTKQVIHVNPKFLKVSIFQVINVLYLVLLVYAVCISVLSVCVVWWIGKLSRAVQRIYWNQE